jgi:uncharacterized PurR-regulated membrane protein YhhQ (DUF165 family)
VWVALYIASIVAVNWLFVVVPPVTTPLGDLYLATFIVGLVFVLRDYAQRQIGHYVLLATVFAGIITWFMVDPALAVASLAAFAISETVDWAIYSFTNKPLQKRILLSSLVSVPVDTLVFLQLAGFLTLPSFSVEAASKAVGVLIVWYLLKLRSERMAEAV